MRRDVLARIRPAPSWWPLVLLPAVSALWLAAALLDVLEAEQLSVVLLFEILLLAVLGWQVFRALLAPLLFLFFLVPFGAFLVPLLQTFTAKFTVQGLQLLGIPVFADGYIIQIPEGTFEVAEACAGLRFLIASIVFGCFFATVVYRSKWRRSVFIALSIDRADRGKRVPRLGSCSARPYHGERSLRDGRPHPLWLAFLHDRDAAADRDRDQLQGGCPPGLAADDAGDAPAPRSQLGPVMATGLLLALAGPAYLYWVERASAAPIAAADGFAIPAQRRCLGSRAGYAAAIGCRPSPERTGSSTVAYRNGSVTVTEFVALYRLPSRGSPLTRAGAGVVRPEPWRLVETGRATASFGGSSVVVNTAKIAREGRRRHVWWFYVIDGQPTGSVVEAKFRQAVATLRGGPHFGALIAIATDVADDLPDELILPRFLAAVHPIARHCRPASADEEARRFGRCMDARIASPNRIGAPVLQRTLLHTFQGAAQTTTARTACVSRSSERIHSHSIILSQADDSTSCLDTPSRRRTGLGNAACWILMCYSIWKQNSAHREQIRKSSVIASASFLMICEWRARGNGRNARG